MSTGAPKEVGTPIRYPSAALLCANTEDGFQILPGSKLLVEGPNPADININLGKPIVSGNLTRLALTEANIQWNIPNVNRLNGNLTMQLFNAAGVSQFFFRVFADVFLKEWYTPYELITALQSVINDDPDVDAYFTGLGATAPYFQVFMCNRAGAPTLVAGPYLPAPTADLTISTDIPTICIKLRDEVYANPYGSGPVLAGPLPSALAKFTVIPSTASSAVTGLPSLQSDLTSMLGITPTTVNGPITTLIGGYASFQYTPYVDLVSRTLCKNQKVADADTSVNTNPQKLARLYLNNETIEPFFASVTYSATTGQAKAWSTNVIGSSPFTMRREFKFPKQISWNSEQNIDFISLEIVDSNGFPLPIRFRSEVLPVSPDLRTMRDGAEYQFTLQVSEI
jgi:hypothetical protein